MVERQMLDAEGDLDPSANAARGLYSSGRESEEGGKDEMSL